MPLGVKMNFLTQYLTYAIFILMLGQNVSWDDESHA